MSLIIESGFDKLQDYFEKNKDKPWNEWLDLETIFPNSGKQGCVGLMKTKTDDSAPPTSIIFKFSKYMNYLVQHELSVMSSLNSVSAYCPHFCKSIGGIVCQVDATKRNEDSNPFILESKYSIEKEVLLCEYVSKLKFSSYMRSSKAKEETLFSLTKQTLVATLIGQIKKNFAHYDLHSNNIMLKKCSKDLVFLYVVDDETQFCIPTRGYYPVIIDFGFSYSSGLEGDYAWPTLSHTDVGYMSDRFDPFSDPKLFLITVSDEIRSSIKTRKTRKFKNIVKNIYGKLKLDWDSGWDCDTEKGAMDSVLKKIDCVPKISKTFDDYDYHCMDIVQSLITFPLENVKTSIDIKKSYKAFLEEFCKIEREIGNPFYCLYILKGIVDSARNIRKDYEENVKIKPEIPVGFFRQSILERIDSIANYCILKDLNYEKMLCSLYCFSKGMESILYKSVGKRMEKKNKMYSKLKIKDIVEILNVIEVNLPDDYNFNDKTEIIVIDCKKEECYPYKLDNEDSLILNSYESVYRGGELYKLMNSEKYNINPCINKNGL
jgi:hypothetical protein